MSTCNKFKSEIKAELVQILKLAVITGFTQFLVVLPSIVSIMVSGHFDKQSLDAAGMGFCILNVFAFAVTNGLSTASETLFSQTHGSSNISLFGIVVQKSLLITIMSTFLIVPILIHTDSLLFLSGQSEELSSMSLDFIFACIPGIFGYDVLIIQMKYLQVQKIVTPCLLTGVMANILNAGYLSAFFFGSNIGLIGCGLSFSLTFWSWNLLLFVYIRITKVYKDSWTGLHTDCLRDWAVFLKYGIPGIFMVQVESISFEIYMLLAGLLGPVQLSSHTVLTSVGFIIYNTAFGAKMAATLQIGNHLGGGYGDKAKIATYATAILAVLFSTVVSLTLLILHKAIPQLFSKDDEVIALATSMFLFFCVVQFFNVLTTILSGVIHSIGRHLFGAIANIISLGIVAIPFAVYLMFWTSLGVLGAWIALFCGLCAIVVVFTIKISLIDWEVEVRRAQVNAGVQTNNQHTNQTESNSVVDEQTFMNETKNRRVSKSKIIGLRIVQASLCILILVISILIDVYIRKPFHSG
ncbi:hypothetical protein SNE40_022089 [Patella caerulea]|uniref:Multidrug and toxin extrusion protein n=1 Tax=Patella caerulea TaxID=87958 RepID=A0AAN8G1L0_PATCE